MRSHSSKHPFPSWPFWPLATFPSRVLPDCQHPHPACQPTLTGGFHFPQTLRACERSCQPALPHRCPHRPPPGQINFPLPVNQILALARAPCKEHHPQRQRWAGKTPLSIEAPSLQRGCCCGTRCAHRRNQGPPASRAHGCPATMLQGTPELLQPLPWPWQPQSSQAFVPVSLPSWLLSTQTGIPGEYGAIQGHRSLLRAGVCWGTPVAPAPLKQHLQC